MESILIVDDEPAIREIFAIYLEMGGFKSVAVPGGMECLEQLKIQKPDLILLDLMMEPMDGWETLQAIRKDPSSSQIPVIIITGKQPTLGEILKYGGLIEDFIVKPVDFNFVSESFHRIIEKDRELSREMNRIKEEQNPELLSEYTRFLRLIRVIHNLINRLEDPQWTAQIPLKNMEEQLQLLHKKLGFPDQFLAWDEGG